MARRPSNPQDVVCSTLCVPDPPKQPCTVPTSAQLGIVQRAHARRALYARVVDCSVVAYDGMVRAQIVQPRAVRATVEQMVGVPSRTGAGFFMGSGVAWIWDPLSRPDSPLRFTTYFLRNAMVWTPSMAGRGMGGRWEVFA